MTAPAPESSVPSVTPSSTASAEAGPHDRCARCGRPTPLGVSLCEEHNPGRIKAPSSTQAHGTILLGVIGGFVLLAIGARFAVGDSGPFTASVQGRSTDATGTIHLVVDVTNDGDAASPATCRVTRDGAPRQEDLEFRTSPIAAGDTLRIERTLTSAGDSVAYDPERLTIRCS